MKQFNAVFILAAIIFVFNTYYSIAKDDNKLELRPEKEEHKVKELTFKANIADLWFKHDGLNDDKTLEKKKDAKKEEKNIMVETADVSLQGEFYKTPTEVHAIPKKQVDRSTIEGLAESVFSAMREGNLKWIAENYVDEEEEQIKDAFKNKNDLKAAKLDFENIKAEHLLGHAIYKDYTLVFIEQEYNIGKKLIETIACKQTTDGWKVTNGLGNDKTFDIVFAALSSGEVTNNKGISLSRNSLETKITKPEIRIVR